METESTKIFFSAIKQSSKQASLPQKFTDNPLTHKFTKKSTEN